MLIKTMTINMGYLNSLKARQIRHAFFSIALIISVVYLLACQFQILAKFLTSLSENLEDEMASTHNLTIYARENSNPSSENSENLRNSYSNNSLKEQYGQDRSPTSPKESPSVNSELPPENENSKANPADEINSVNLEGNFENRKSFLVLDSEEGMTEDEIKEKKSLKKKVVRDVRLNFMPRDFMCDQMHHLSNREFEYPDNYMDHADAYKSALVLYDIIEQAMPNEQTWVLMELVRLPFMNTVCHLGFDAGHAAFHMLTVNEDIVTRIISDPEAKNYSREMADFLTIEFPDRIFFYEGKKSNFLETVKEMIRTENQTRCDAVYVDDPNDFEREQLSDILSEFRKIISGPDNLLIFNLHPYWFRFVARPPQPQRKAIHRNRKMSTLRRPNLNRTERSVLPVFTSLPAWNENLNGNNFITVSNGNVITDNKLVKNTEANQYVYGKKLFLDDIAENNLTRYRVSIPSNFYINVNKNNNNKNINNNKIDTIIKNTNHREIELNHIMRTKDNIADTKVPHDYRVTEMKIITKSSYVPVSATENKNEIITNSSFEKGNTGGEQRIINKKNPLSNKRDQIEMVTLNNIPERRIGSTQSNEDDIKLPFENEAKIRRTNENKNQSSFDVWDRFIGSGQVRELFRCRMSYDGISPNQKGLTVGSFSAQVEVKSSFD